MLLKKVFKSCNSILLEKILKPASCQLTTSQLKSKYIDEPEYLKFTKPQVPVYELLNIQIKCYDFTILEHYAKHVHKIALNMEINVVDAWATPHQAWKITNFEPGTTKVSTEYTLNTYERNIQVSNLAAYSAPLFLDVIQSSLPSGVTMSIHPHEQQHNEIRYIPDFELIALKNKLTEITESTKK